MRTLCILCLMLLLPSAACAQKTPAPQERPDYNADYATYTCERLHTEINALGKKFEQLHPGDAAMAAARQGAPLPKDITQLSPEMAEAAFVYSRMQLCRKYIQEKQCPKSSINPMHPGPAIPGKAPKQ